MKFIPIVIQHEDVQARDLVGLHELQFIPLPNDPNACGPKFAFFCLAYMRESFVFGCYGEFGRDDCNPGALFSTDELRWMRDG